MARQKKPAVNNTFVEEAREIMAQALGEIEALGFNVQVAQGDIDERVIMENLVFTEVESGV